MKKLTRDEIQAILKRFDLDLEGYKPGKIRLYAVYGKFNNQPMLTPGYLTYRELCVYLTGFETAENLACVKIR